MRCPNCQVEVQEWHFYCQNCHVQVQSYRPEAEKPRRGRVERAGARVINALVWILIIAALVFTGRAAPWKEIYAVISGDPAPSAKSDAVPKDKRSPRVKSEAGRHEDKTSTPAKTIEKQKEKKEGSSEIGRATLQKIGELPSVEGQLQTQKVSFSLKPLQVNSPAPPTATTPAAKSESSAASGEAHSGAERMDAGSGNGEVAINSDVPAKIYINGQFSGTTPRTVKMNAGDLQIRLIADGYDDWTRRVKLKTRQQLGITASMKKRDAQRN